MECLHRRAGGTEVRERGFTLIEQLAVLLVLAILSAIALPAIMQQREKGWIAQTQSALKDSSTAAFAFANSNGGTWEDLDELADLEDEGYRVTEGVAISVDGETLEYCLRALHLQLPPEHEWKVASFDSENQAPVPDDDCP
ncbi:MAG TPA: prepilin-type N-terminal cleavage/methylation domain-containing protein [Actinomycetota bacterium]|nr:prepilin-type N-terminal cleavage/methylation domain-containing protein [Actinomycetota bacterium]